MPVEYFTSLDHSTGRRLDAHERPELSSGSVEYVAPAEYMVSRGLSLVQALQAAMVHAQGAPQAAGAAQIMGRMSNPQESSSAALLVCFPPQALLHGPPVPS